MKIEDVPSFDAETVVERMAARWGWLGRDAAKGMLDYLAPDIAAAIRGACEEKGCITPRKEKA